jgi:hypothetical protein
MLDNEGRDARGDVSKPLFIIVEAQRTSRFFEHSLQAELIRQLKTQLIRSCIQFLSFLPSDGFFALTFLGVSMLDPG